MGGAQRQRRGHLLSRLRRRAIRSASLPRQSVILPCAPCVHFFFPRDIAEFEGVAVLGAGPSRTLEDSVGLLLSPLARVRRDRWVTELRSLSLAPPKRPSYWPQVRIRIRRCGPSRARSRPTRWRSSAASTNWGCAGGSPPRPARTIAGSRGIGDGVGHSAYPPTDPRGRAERPPRFPHCSGDGAHSVRTITARQSWFIVHTANTKSVRS